MSEHTPGPWRVDPEHWGDVQDANGHEICAVFDENDQGEQWKIGGTITATTREGWANARLIAAAPDLLAALEAIMNARWRPEGMSEENADRARAAIARATGASS